MLIINDEQRLQAGIPSLSEQCPCCGKALATYPLILSDDVEQPVYHAACAIEVATEILVDVSTFFSPPAPYDRLFVCDFSRTLSAPDNLCDFGADCQNVWPFSAKRLAAVMKWRQSSLLAAPPDFASGRGYGEC